MAGLKNQKPEKNKTRSYLQNLIQVGFSEALVLFHDVFFLKGIPVPGRLPVRLFENLEDRGPDRQVKNNTGS